MEFLPSLGASRKEDRPWRRDAGWSEARGVYRMGKETGWDTDGALS